MQVFNAEEIKRVVGLDGDSLAAVESAFTALTEGRVIMPAPMVLHLPEVDGEVHVKTATIKGLSGFAVKVATGFYRNPEKGLPSSNGMVLYLDAETGIPVAVFADEGYLTDLRTALAGAIAAKYLAREDAKSVGVIGAGTQARWQVRALRLVREVQQVHLWARRQDAAQRLLEEFASQDGLNVQVSPTIEALAQHSEIVITATPSREALLHAHHLRPGMHVTAMGSGGPGNREVSSETLTHADLVVCDSIDQCSRLGELQYLNEAQRSHIAPKLAELGEITAGKRPGRTSHEQVTICDLTGVGAQDTAIANLAWERLTKT